MIESLRALGYECCCCATELQRWLPPPPPPAVRLNCRLGKPYDLEPTTTTSKASEYEEEWEVNEYSSNAKWGKVIWSLAAAAARRIIIPFSFRGSWSVLAVKGPPPFLSLGSLFHYRCNFACVYGELAVCSAGWWLVHNWRINDPCPRERHRWWRGDGWKIRSQQQCCERRSE